MRSALAIRSAPLALVVIAVLSACGDDGGGQAQPATTESAATPAPTDSAAATSVAELTPATTGDTTSSGSAPADSIVAADERFPEIVGVEATRDGDTWTFAVTVSSPYDSPEQYADGWRVVGPDDEVYGEHTLTHDHATEQPFTRTQSGVTIPDDVIEVTIEGRDLLNGYGGETKTVTLDPASSAS